MSWESWTSSLVPTVLLPLNPGQHSVSSCGHLGSTRGFPAAALGLLSFLPTARGILQKEVRYFLPPQTLQCQPASLPEVPRASVTCRSLSSRHSVSVSLILHLAPAIPSFSLFLEHSKYLLPWAFPLPCPWPEWLFLLLSTYVTSVKPWLRRHCLIEVCPHYLVQVTPAHSLSSLTLLSAFSIAHRLLLIKT